MTSPAAAAPEPYMTTKEAVAYTRCSPSVISRAVNSGRLRAVSPTAGSNRTIRLFRREWLDEWLLGGAPTPPPPAPRRLEPVPVDPRSRRRVGRPTGRSATTSPQVQ